MFRGARIRVPASGECTDQTEEIRPRLGECRELRPSDSSTTCGESQAPAYRFLLDVLLLEDTVCFVLHRPRFTFSAERDYLATFRR